MIIDCHTHLNRYVEGKPPSLRDRRGRRPQIGVIAGVSYYHYTAHDLADLRVLLRTGQIKGLKLYLGYEAFYVHDPRMRVVSKAAWVEDR